IATKRSVWIRQLAPQFHLTGKLAVTPQAKAVVAGSVLNAVHRVDVRFGPQDPSGICCLSRQGWIKSKVCRQNAIARSVRGSVLPQQLHTLRNGQIVWRYAPARRVPATELAPDK